MNTSPLVGIIMGSQSDWPTMKHAADMLDRLGVSYESRITSAHRTPRAKSAHTPQPQAWVLFARWSQHGPGCRP